VKLLLLAILAIPVQAQAPEVTPEEGMILISAEERAALIRKFGEQQEILEEAVKRYKHCMMVKTT
jgi:hypothetical protein